MRSVSILAIVVAVALAGFAVYLISFSTSSPTASNMVSQSTSTPQAPTSSGNASSSSIECFQEESNGTISVKLVQDATLQPDPGIHIFAYELSTCGTTRQVDLGFTNSTGSAPMQLNWTGKYTVEVDFNSQTIFGFSGQTSGGTTLDTLSVPSGLVTELVVPCEGQGCQGSTTTTTANITTAVPGG
jgi:hypothetical protein